MQSLVEMFDRYRAFRSLAIILAAVLVFDAFVLARRMRYQREIAQARASMSAIELQRTDDIVSHEKNKFRVGFAIARGQAETALHLVISIDGGVMLLQRDGVLLRAMPIRVGPERVGIAPHAVRLATPRGLRTIARLMTAEDPWDVPAWVYADRGVQLPPWGLMRGALGPIAVILAGGTLVYSMPVDSPLGDSSYILPGAVRAHEDDLRAILPSLRPGMRVYIH